MTIELGCCEFWAVSHMVGSNVPTARRVRAARSREPSGVCALAAVLV
jgi:hypothetical protein